MEKRNTIQRGLVLEAVLQLACHPTADEVYALIVATHPTVSKATVYRNLNSLCEDKVLRRVPMPDTADRFDHNVSEHYHLQCIQCGEFADVPYKYGTDIDVLVEKEFGYTNASHNLLVTGTCAECSKKIC